MLSYVNTVWEGLIPLDYMVWWGHNLPSRGCNVKSVALPLSESFRRRTKAKLPISGCNQRGKTRETSYETTCEISVSKISMEHAGECHISMPIQQLNGTLGQSNMDKNRQAQTTGIEISSADHRINSHRQWKTGKVSGRWQRWTRWVWREENIIFDKRREVASSTSHKNAARVPASPPDIQPLRLSLCWAEVHSRSISCLSQV